jgi:hypothetical protein
MIRKTLIVVASLWLAVSPAAALDDQVVSASYCLAVIDKTLSQLDDGDEKQRGMNYRSEVAAFLAFALLQIQNQADLIAIRNARRSGVNDARACIENGDRTACERGRQRCKDLE